MKTFLTSAHIIFLVLALPAISQTNPMVVEQPAKSPEEERASFTLPPGFDIQLVASEPDIRKPMQLAFDEKGRLLVTTSTNYPLGPGDGGNPSDKVMLIEIDGASGKATSVAAIVDGLNIPSGIEALPGDRIILGHAPDVLLIHHIGDKEDSREVLYTGFARDDTHEILNSFTWGVDGWLYALQGQTNKSTIKDKSGRLLPLYHGNTYRMKPDGSRIEIVAPGMSNPWGQAFDEHYNLFGSDCESRPLWQIVPGFSYPGYRQPKAAAGYAPHITEDGHGASGFAGLVYFDAETFPAEDQRTLFLGNVMQGFIHRDGLKGDGFTRFADRKPDFMASSDPWFRPVDLELGPDGALYIADWYNAVIAHVEVRLDHPARDKERGRIWRVVYRGTEEERADETRKEQIDRQFAGPMQTDWSKASRKQLIAALAHPQTWVRRAAAQQLAYRMPGETQRRLARIARNAKLNETQRAEALWLLERNHELPIQLLERMTEDASSLVRAQSAQLIGSALAGMNSTDTSSIAGVGDLSKALLRLSRDANPDARSRAIMALSMRSTENSAKELLGAALPPREQDTLLHHAVTVSLSKHFADASILASVDMAQLDAQARIRCADALAATPTPEAAELSAKFLDQALVPREHVLPVLENVLMYGQPATLQALYANHSGQSPEDAKTYARAAMNRINERKEIATFLSSDLESIAQRLASQATSESEQLAVHIAMFVNSPSLSGVAEKVMRGDGYDTRSRRDAAICLLRLDHEKFTPTVLEQITTPGGVVAAQRAFAEELGARAKTPAQVDTLITAITPASAEIKRGAVQRMLTQRPGVDLLFDAVEAGKLTPAVLTQPLFDIFVFRSHNDPKLNERYDALVARAPSVTDDDEKVIAALKEKFAAHTPDTARGKIAFEKNCLVCHDMTRRGGLRGPNIEGVGQRGIDRLLQDVVTPSRDVHPSFRTTVITTRDGAVMSGLLLRETATQWVLLDNEANEHTFARAEVEDIRKEWLSPMPSGFGQTLPEAEFLNLLAFLLAGGK
ncbi:MAG: PVC-type heme-binding CxxCH protein [Candidatus Hydrogenedentes bacterium]|nr:PVC-type heme-binding CxxCH protein [Candidatus Hydrogenedentota bacterium]